MRAEEHVVRKFFKEIDSPQISEKLAYRKRIMMLVLRAGKRIWQSGYRCKSIPYFFKGLSRLFN
jgi:hypothetical protein